MPQNKNKVILASAGGRKTTFIVEDALRYISDKVLLTTYTIENTQQITSYLYQSHGFVPKKINVHSWFSFLLMDCVRPYQNRVLPNTEIKGIDFISNPPKYVGKANPMGYYVTRNKYIYRDRVSDLICKCNEESDGLVIKRLEKIYKRIYIDEIQDMSGWDLNLIELLLNSSISVKLVGDPRQSTYATTRSPKNRGKVGENIPVWIDELIKKDLCEVEERVESYRCNQEICDFADALYPDMPKTKSKNLEVTGHDGIFYIEEGEVPEYVGLYDPAILRWNKTTNTFEFPAMNIGVSKGKTFDRVLIFPTKKMKAFLKTADLEIAGDIPKFYVAVTRARFSVAFVVDDKSEVKFPIT